MVIAHGLVPNSAPSGPLRKDNPLVKLLLYALVIGFKLSVMSPRVGSEKVIGLKSYHFGFCIFRRKVSRFGFYGASRIASNQSYSVMEGDRLEDHSFSEPQGRRGQDRLLARFRTRTR